MSADELVVLAEVVTVLQPVDASTAWVDRPRGTVLAPLDDETHDRLLAAGAIGYRTPDTAEPVDDQGDEDPDEVPVGTVDEVLAWAGADKTRAARALAAEEAVGDKARKTLLAQLHDLLVE
ncbi:hypothetical protein [Actinoplanes sp. NPDC051851]|uniref:hypothetical protein n=1 Tax=Actinoplanes sp. NPDC051851 TaxID=3154753 RepID=UPI0034231568